MVFRINHTSSLVTDEAARVVLRQFEPVKHYFQLVSAWSKARSYPRTKFQLRLSVRGRPAEHSTLSPNSSIPCFNIFLSR